jgi:hypothetical protein
LLLTGWQVGILLALLGLIATTTTLCLLPTLALAASTLARTFAFALARTLTAAALSSAWLARAHAIVLALLADLTLTAAFTLRSLTAIR